MMNGEILTLIREVV